MTPSGKPKSACQLFVEMGHPWVLTMFGDELKKRCSPHTPHNCQITDSVAAGFRMGRWLSFIAPIYLFDKAISSRLAKMVRALPGVIAVSQPSPVDSIDEEVALATFLNRSEAARDHFWEDVHTKRRAYERDVTQSWRQDVARYGFGIAKACLDLPQLEQCLSKIQRCEVEARVHVRSGDIGNHFFDYQRLIDTAPSGRKGLDRLRHAAKKLRVAFPLPQHPLAKDLLVEVDWYDRGGKSLFYSSLEAGRDEFLLAEFEIFVRET